MPIRIPDGLPARDALVSEGVQILDESIAVRQDIRPLHIGLLNLMPNKVATETQIARLIGASPLQVELTLVGDGDRANLIKAVPRPANFKLVMPGAIDAGADRIAHRQEHAGRASDQFLSYLGRGEAPEI